MARIRVLVVDDVQESRDNVERLISFEPEFEIVGSAARGQEAVEAALSLRPDVILMDVNMPDIDGITATRQILSQQPSIGVIMMSVQNEPDILRRSMLAGAREYLVKPFSFDDLLDSIRNVHNNRPATLAQPVVVQDGIAGTVPSPAKHSGKATIISVVGLKGGIGRSVVASNLAVAMRKQSGKRVGIVDANISFGDIAVMMNVSDGKTILDAVPFQRQVDAELLSTILVEHSTGVNLLLAPPSPREAESVTPDLLKASATAMAGMFDVVVIDTQPSFEEANLALFDMSDILLLVVTMDMTAIKDARQFLEVAELLGYQQERIRLVLNRTNTYSGIPALEIGESLKRPLWARIPDDPGPVQRSINEGVPLVESNGESKVSEEINRMAREILGEISPDMVAIAGDQRQQSNRLVGRFLKRSA